MPLRPVVLKRSYSNRQTLLRYRFIMIANAYIAFTPSVDAIPRFIAELEMRTARSVPAAAFYRSANGPAFRHASLFPRKR